MPLEYSKDIKDICSDVELNVNNEDEVSDYIADLLEQTKIFFDESIDNKRKYEVLLNKFNKLSDNHFAKRKEHHKERAFFNYMMPVYSSFKVDEFNKLYDSGVYNDKQKKINKRLKKRILI